MSASRLKSSFFIRCRQVGGGASCYIIAEAGTNHNGSLDQALSLIDRFAEAGADAVKFQSIRASKIFHGDDLDEAATEFWAPLELPERWYPKLAEQARARGVDFLSTPCYPEAIRPLVKAGVPAFKIASRQVARHPELLAAAARTGLPLVLSLGLCDLAAIHRAVAGARRGGATSLALLRCTPRYPARADAANLLAMETLRSAFGVPVGFSDHTQGLAVPIAAAARGAAIIEKHVTLDRTAAGPDHHFAMDPPTFAAMVRGVRDAEAACGSARLGELPAEDQELYRDSAYYLVLARPLGRGDRITRARLRFLRTGKGIPLEQLDEALGQKLRRASPTGTILSWDDLESSKGPGR